MTLLCFIVFQIFHYCYDDTIEVMVKNNYKIPMGKITKCELKMIFTIS